MGMVAYFVPIAPDMLEALKADPGLVESFIFPDEDDSDEEPEGTVDVDKAWHGIHHLLFTIANNDEQSPLSWAVLGGEPLGEDFGYGPPRVLDPEQVRQVASALAAVSTQQLEAAFDPPAMSSAEIYPDIWERDGKEALDYLLHYFPKLVAFYQDAARHGHGAVLYLA